MPTMPELTILLEAPESCVQATVTQEVAREVAYVA